MTHDNYVCLPPPIESLSEGLADHIYWPEELLSQPEFIKQIEAQRILLQRLRHVFEALPLGLSLADGLSQGFVTDAEAECLYDSLTFQLGADEVQGRLSMYLPFELLSPITSGSEAVRMASARFQSAYRSAWEIQLTQHEVRANYVDGDVLEPELLVGDHPRVVKAAHLIPGLLRAGHLTAVEVLEYEEQSTDLLLVQSIRDACVITTDLGLLEPGAMKHTSHHANRTPTSTGDMTEGRARWLAMVAETKVLQKRAEAIASALADDQFDSEVLKDEEPWVAIEAIRIASLKDVSIFNRHQTLLKTLVSASCGSSVKDGITKLCAHLHAQGLIGDEVLEDWGVAIPHLNGPFYSNRSRLEPSVDSIIDMCVKAGEHARLNQLVYPVALIFGSRIKGYGLSEADCDIAVFVRPGVDRKEQEYLEQELMRVYDHKNFNGDVKLFWLTENDGHLQVIDWPNLTASDGWSSWLHVLFGALWFGKEEQIKLLHKRLLGSYFTAPDTLRDGKPIYVRWLEEIERDSLQYRLLHKGFERFYPIQSPMDTKHGSLIDGKSAFYDSRYRRMATELFVRRVFLPRL